MTPEEQLAHDVEMEKQLRDLAAQIAQMTKLPFDPMTIRKAVVAAVNDFADPPTVSLNISGDDQTLVTQVRTLNNYTPLIGQTVLMAKQGAEIFILGAIASINPKSATANPDVMENGWTKVTLSNGSHEVNANSVYYRRVLDHGAWKMQWRGVWVTGGSSTMVASGDALDSEFRPSSYRSLSCAREASSSSAHVPTVRMDFNADGTITMVQSKPDVSVSIGTNGSFSVGSHTHAIPFDGDADGGGADHNHFGVALSGGGFSVSDHGHSASATVTVNHPDWVSLNGVEYFL